MQVLMSVLRIMLFIFIFRAFTTIIRGLMLSKKIRDGKQNTKKDSGQNNTENVSEEDIVEMFKDSYCGTFVAKEKAYITKINDENHYFCSWDCREKYLQQVQ